MTEQDAPLISSLVIVGTGAMACLFGARLAPHTQVTLLGSWKEGLKALRDCGIKLTDGEVESTHPVRATSDVADCDGYRYALVLVKAWQTAQAARLLEECLSPDGIALTLQNGLGNLEELRRVLGPERASLGVTAVGATLLGPGHVRAGGTGSTHLLRQPGLEPLAHLLRRAGFQIRMTGSLESLQWTKLIVNASINPLTALLRVPNGEVLRRPHARRLMAAVARETAAVAVRRGAPLQEIDPVATVEKVARQTSSNHSSMLQDVLRGAPTEIDAISGAVVREAEGLDMPSPVNRTLWHLIKALVSSPSGGRS